MEIATPTMPNRMRAVENTEILELRSTCFDMRALESIKDAMKKMTALA
jgi:hypothetical protein